LADFAQEVADPGLEEAMLARLAEVKPSAEVWSRLATREREFGRCRRAALAYGRAAKLTSGDEQLRLLYLAALTGSASDPQEAEVVLGELRTSAKAGKSIVWTNAAERALAFLHGRDVGFAHETTVSDVRQREPPIGVSVCLTHRYGVQGLEALSAALRASLDLAAVGRSSGVLLH
jgi:hypothetical protein